MAFLLGTTTPVQAGGGSPGGHGAGLVLSPDVGYDYEIGTDIWDRKKRKRRRRRRKKRTFAIGAVVGGPTNLGARALLRVGYLGLAGDFTYQRLRSDAGPLVDVFTTKADLRLYSKSFFGRIFRFYVFGGTTLQHGAWDGEVMQTAVLLDAGAGAGIKLWRLSINAEAGLLIPARELPAYKPRFGAFANVAVLLWLF